MATYYVSTTGSGTGVGSEVDPFTISQASGFGSFGDVFLFEPGTYEVSSTVQINRRVKWSAKTSTRPVIVGTTPFTGTRVVEGLVDGTVLKGFEVDATATLQTAIYNMASASECKATGQVGSSSGVVRANHIDRCEVIQLGSATPLYFSTVAARSLITGGSVLQSWRLLNCIVSHVSSTGSTLAFGATNTIFRNTGGYAVNFDSLEGPVDRILAVDCVDAIDLNGFDMSAFVSNSFEANSTNPAPSGYDITAITDPFEDASTLDFRLTTAAKSSGDAEALKQIMVGLVDVPGITTDTLSELFGGGGSSAFNPYQSAFYRR